MGHTETKIKNSLSPGENNLGYVLVFPKGGRDSGVLFLTENRICLMQEGGLFGQRGSAKSIPLEQISSINFKSSFSGNDIEIGTSSENLELSCLSTKKEGQSFIDLAKQTMAQKNRPAAPPPPPNASNDPIEMISKLAKLKEIGAITEEEFESKKKELLGKIG